MSGFPTPFARQQAMASSRITEMVTPDDSASACSYSSWQRCADDGQLPGRPVQIHKEMGPLFKCLRLLHQVLVLERSMAQRHVLSLPLQVLTCLKFLQM